MGWTLRRTFPGLVVAAFLICFSPWAMSQQNKTSGPQHNSSADSAKHLTIQGCISGEKRYTFMQTGTGAMFALTGDTARFVSVQGKLVEVTAAEFPSGGKANELPELQVNHLRVVAEKCPIQAEAPSAEPKPAQGNQHPAGPEKSPSTEPYTDAGTENQKPPGIKNPNIEGDTGAPSPGTGNPPAANPNAPSPPPSPQ